MNPSKSIIIAGSGRSGTTWLAEIIAACHGCRLVFEPFDCRKVPQAKNLPLRTYMRPDGNYPQWELLIRDTLTGKITNKWTNSFNIRHFASQCVIKTIRANLMLGWISQKYNNNIVYIIRHPCATVFSRLQLNWDTHLDVFLSQQELMEDYLFPYESLIKNAKTKVEQHTIMWCIENIIPLKQLAKYNYFFITYEQLCLQTEIEINNILSFLGLHHNSNVSKAIYKRSMSRPNSAIITGKDKLSSWTEQLSRNDIKLILNIVTQFEINIYNSNPIPHL